MPKYLAARVRDKKPKTKEELADTYLHNRDQDADRPKKPDDGRGRDPNQPNTRSWKGYDRRTDRERKPSDDHKRWNNTDSYRDGPQSDNTKKLNVHEIERGGENTESPTDKGQTWSKETKPWNKPKFDKDLGPRCFSCNEYGHYSSRCPTKSTSESSQINRPTILRTESVGWKTDQRHGGRHWSRQDSSPKRSHATQTDQDVDVVLRTPDLNKKFILQSDASGVGIGAVLSQLDDENVERPVAFYSIPPETRYSAVELECLAVVEGVKHFRVYVTGVPFSIQTDHRCLV